MLFPITTTQQSLSRNSLVLFLLKSIHRKKKKKKKTWTAWTTSGQNRNFVLLKKQKTFPESERSYNKSSAAVKHALPIGCKKTRTDSPILKMETLRNTQPCFHCHLEAFRSVRALHPLTLDDRKQINKSSNHSFISLRVGHQSFFVLFFSGKHWNSFCKSLKLVCIARI